MRARAARSSPPSSPRSASRRRSRTSNGRSGCQNVYTDKNYDLTIISHVEPLDIGIYAKPELLLQLRQPGFQRDHRAAGRRAPDIDAYKKALVEAQHKLADDSVNAFLFQLPNVVVADAKLKGLWKNAPIFANDLAALSWK